MHSNIDEIWSKVVDKVETETGIDCTFYRKATFHMNDGVRSTENIPVQNPNWMSLPGLTTKPWWSIDDFDPKLQRYLRQMEEHYAEYLEEFEKNMNNIEFGAGTATVYFGENQGWRAFLFYDEEARPVTGASKVFPKIAALLKQMREDDYIAKSHFSVLKSGASIDVHCGGVNHELRMHYGLRIPDGDIAIKVGGETRHWENGKVLLFDDTFPHQVWNNTSEDRYILHCRIQHPGLSEVERKAAYILDQELTVALEEEDVSREPER